jgi:hypothetical protein
MAEVLGLVAVPGEPPDMNTQHIGAAGELLVQYQLLKLGIDSARLTTDARGRSCGLRPW